MHLVLALLAASVRAQVVELAAPRASPAAGRRAIGAPLPTRWCHEDWRLRRQGGCWVPVDGLPGEGKIKAYVHPGGWIVDPRCLDDRRFDPGQFIAALDEAQRKTAGGCLDRFNPAMGRVVRDAVWAKPTYVSCGEWAPTSMKCAQEGASGGANLIEVLNVRGCIEPGSTGLAGTLFHETLHAAGIDNWPVEKHNAVATMPQFEFIRDRVYGTEATCFYGTDAATRKKANFLQCLGTISFETDRPDRALCEGFGHDYYDTPPSYSR